MVQDATKPGTVLGNFSQEGNPFEVAKDLDPDDIVYTLGSKWKQRYQQYQDFIQSSHYKIGDISCTSCHQSHQAYNEQGELPLKEGSADALCESCHKEGGRTAALEKPYLENYTPKRAKSVTEADIRTHLFTPDQPQPPKPKEPYRINGIAVMSPVVFSTGLFFKLLSFH